MWIAKDKSGQVHAFISKPVRYKDDDGTEYSFWDAEDEDESYITLLSWVIECLLGIKDIVDNLKWEDEPIELTFTINKNVDSKG